MEVWIFSIVITLILARNRVENRAGTDCGSSFLGKTSMGSTNPSAQQVKKKLNVGSMKLATLPYLVSRCKMSAFWPCHGVCLDSKTQLILIYYSRENVVYRQCKKLTAAVY